MNAVRVYVPHELIAVLLRGWKRYDCIVLPDLNAARDEQGQRRDIPEDAELLAVHYCHERLAFCLRFTHHSFPLTPPGDRLPEWCLSAYTLTALKAEAVTPDQIVFERV